MINLGYACINMELSASGISTNRGMIKKTYLAKGKTYAGELAEKNLVDLKKILQWNTDNNIKVYRMSSSIFPWMSEYEFKDLPNYHSIKKLCEEIGEYANDFGQRLSFHPGHFDILATQSLSTLENTILDLNRHSQIMDMMNLSTDSYNTINIHVGGAYGDKKSALERFCTNFKKLEKNTQKRLTVENDDKVNMYSVKELHDGVYSEIGIPIIFDFHHHRMCMGGLNEEEALKLASTTWKNSRQLTHYSSSKKINEDSSVNQQAHADYVYEKINSYGLEIDIEIEAKMKEAAVLNYLKQYS